MSIRIIQPLSEYFQLGGPAVHPHHHPHHHELYRLKDQKMTLLKFFGFFCLSGLNSSIS